MDQQADVRRKPVTVVFNGALADQIDDWRRRQPEIPTVAAGVRRLVARAVETEHVHG